MVEFRPFIYGLVDPIDPRHIRYVGMASVRESRPLDHARNARCISAKATHLICWIRKLQFEGRDYQVVKLEQLAEVTSKKFLGFIESCYVKSLREIGHDLTNGTDGGEGGDTGRLQTAAEREAMSAFQTGRTRSAETRALMAEAKRNRLVTDATKKNLSATLTGRKLTDAHRANISLGQRGHKVSPETREKLRLAWLRRKATW